MTPERERLVRAVEEAQQIRDVSRAGNWQVAQGELIRARQAIAAYDAAHKGETDETA